MTINCHKCGLGLTERSIITLPFTKKAILEALADVEFLSTVDAGVDAPVVGAAPDATAEIRLQVHETAPAPPRKPMFGA